MRKRKPPRTLGIFFLRIFKLKKKIEITAYLEPERRVEAMKNLGDLQVAAEGRAKEGHFVGDWKLMAFSFIAISFAV